MDENVRQRDVRYAVDAALREMTGAAQYGRSQRAATSGRGSPGHGYHPREYDESGFPIPQEGPGFVQRVARLLSPF